MAAVKKASKGYLLSPLNGGVRWAFVPHPEIPGTWCRVHFSVLVVKCDYCGAEIGEPCLGANGKRWVSNAHTDRKESGNKQRSVEVQTHTGSCVIDLRRISGKEKTSK